MIYSYVGLRDKGAKINVHTSILIISTGLKHGAGINLNDPLTQ